MTPEGQYMFAWLPEDILLLICGWLSVRDVLVMRSVNQHLSAITRNSSIWLSFLRRLTLALSPWHYISSHVPVHDVEYLVSSALRLDRNWKDNNPLPNHYRFKGHQRILTMRYLPGEKYMVSVSQDPVTKGEGIVIWDMKYRGHRSHIAIAMFSSETPIQKLQVRYGAVSGKAILLMAFMKPPIDGRTFITVIYITLELLEILSNLGPGTAKFAEYAELNPNPFTKILETRTPYPVGALSMSNVQGQPILATVHRPRTIAFYFLDSKQRASLKLAAVTEIQSSRHSIWEIKILPSQNQILVIRVLIEDGFLGTNPIVFEIYNIPPPEIDAEFPTPCDTLLIRGYRIDGIYVSDAESSWSTARKSQIPPAYCPPSPISVFLTTREPRGFLHYLVLPSIVNDGPTSPAEETFIYKLPTKTHAAFEWDDEQQAVIIPGAYRSIVWMRSPRRQPLQGIEVLQLAIYRTQGYAFSDSFDTGHISTISEKELMSVSEGESMDTGDELETAHSQKPNFENPRDRAMKYPVVPIAVAQAMRRAMQAIQFDEWLGRLYIATTEDSWVHVMDWSI